MNSSFQFVFVALGKYKALRSSCSIFLLHNYFYYSDSLVPQSRLRFLNAAKYAITEPKSLFHSTDARSSKERHKKGRD